MKILSKTLGPKLFKRFSLWYYKTFPSESFTDHPVYKAMVLIRAAEANLQVDNLVGADSVIHGGEVLFEMIESTRDIAISGDTTEGFLSRIDSCVLPYKPKTVILHIGGNDILNRVEMDVIVDNLCKIHSRLKKAGVKRIAFIEILPLAKEAADAHRTAAELNQIVKSQLPFDFIETRSLLAGPDGFIADKYRGDVIHANALAYNDVFYPIVAKYIRGGK